MNGRYGKSVSDEQYIKRVVKDAQGKIDTMQEDCPECYGEDGAKEIILDWLDELGVYPDDIDVVFAQLDFCNYSPA